MTNDERREWIVKRYGPIALQKRTVMYGEKHGAIASVMIATVPIMSGIAIGAGADEEYAILSLYNDLSGETWATNTPS